MQTLDSADAKRLTQSYDGTNAVLWVPRTSEGARRPSHPPCREALSAFAQDRCAAQVAGHWGGHARGTSTPVRLPSRSPCWGLRLPLESPTGFGLARMRSGACYRGRGLSGTATSTGMGPRRCRLVRLGARFDEARHLDLGRCRRQADRRVPGTGRRAGRHAAECSSRIPVWARPIGVLDVGRTVDARRPLDGL